MLFCLFFRTLFQTIWQSREQYGIIGLVTVLITILDVFVTYGFGNSLVKDKDSDQLDFSTCFFFGLTLAAGVYACTFFAAPLIAAYYNEEMLTPVIRVMALRVPLAAVNSVQHAYVSKHMIFRKFFISTSIGTVLSGVVAIIMAYHGFGVWALVEQYLGNVVCDTVCLWIIVGWRPSLRFSFQRLKRIYSYGWKILATGLIDTGYNQLRSLVIAKRYTKADLAYYSKGNQFPVLFIQIIEPTVIGVLFPALSKCNDSVVEMRGITRRVIKVSSYVCFPLMVGLAVVAEPLITVILTKKWLDSAIFLQIGSMAYMFRTLQFINTSVIKASGNSGLLLKLDILKKVIGVALLLIGMQFGVTGIAVSYLLTNLISTAINIGPNRKILNYGYAAQIRDILPNLAIALGMGAIVYGIGRIEMNTYLLLLAQVCAGVGAYVLLSAVTRNDSFRYLLTIIKKKLKKGGKSKKTATV